MENTRGRKIRRVMKDADVKALPSDLWFEILRRIPAADLHPLKAVCKTFHRLISSDLFARLHLEDLINDPKSKRAIFTPKFRYPDHNSYYYDPDKNTISVWYDDKPIFNDFCPVIDSYHGLLLVQVGDRLLLCNPITRSCKFLPTIYDFQQLSYWKLAYDDVSNQYKVFGLRIRKEREVSLYVFDVHRDQELHYPRVKTAMDCQNMELYYGGNVLVNGNVYWLFKTPEQSRIISSSVITEEVKTRTCSIQRYRDSTIGAANGTFYVYPHRGITIVANGTFYQYAISRPNYDELKLWVLEGVESENSNPSWTMKHIIHLNQLASTLSIDHAVVLGVFCNKVLIIIRSRNCLRLFQYDMSCKKFEGEVTLAIGGKNIAEFQFYRVVEHIDSLIKS